MSKTFLMSVDYEDLRLQFPDGQQYKDRNEVLTERILSFFRERNIKATFFTVGELAELHPDLIRKINGEGHEIACHTYNHQPLELHNQESFRNDLDRALVAFKKAGVDTVVGFRAPFFSMTSKTRWVYTILREYGFEYSSSVLPAKSPLYGWPEFGKFSKKIDGIWEMPITLTGSNVLKVPLAGGIYFRVLPNFALRMLSDFNSSKYVTSYFHPYDLDYEQEWFKHPGIPDRFHFHILMKLNRRGFLKKLDRYLNQYQNVMRYTDITNELSEGSTEI